MMQSDRKIEDRVYKNAWDCYLKIYKNEGMNAFYKGAFSNILRGTGAALVLVFYDKIQYYTSSAHK